MTHSDPCMLQNSCNVFFYLFRLAYHIAVQRDVIELPSRGHTRHVDNMAHSLNALG